MNDAERNTTLISRASVQALAGLIVVILSLHIIRMYRKLGHVPGPFLAKFTNFQRVYWVKSMQAHKIHLQMHEKYGDCVRYGPEMVSVSDPGAIPTLYPMRPGFPKSKFYRAFIPYSKTGSLPAIFTTQDEQQHKELKSPIASLYSLSHVATLDHFVDDVLKLLFQELDLRFVTSQQTFDLGDWLQYFAFEVMGTMTFSRRYGLLEAGADVNGMLGAIWQFMLTIAPMTQIAWLDKFWYKNSLVASFRKPNASPILKIVSDSINERQLDLRAQTEEDRKKKEKDFLTHFLETQSRNPSIPPWYVRAWTFSNVIAGSDSTAAVMKTVMYHLLTHPESEIQLHNEILAAERAGRLTRPFPTWNEVKDLPYLDACVNEAVRLHPPFCLPLERIVPVGGITICGKFFPSGTLIGMNPYVVNRHRPTFGEDADSWRPERWLVKDTRLKRKLEGSILTFGAGRRVCVGKHVALLEIKKIVPAIFLNYKIELIDPNLYYVENSYFFRQKGIMVKIDKLTTEE